MDTSVDAVILGGGTIKQTAGEATAVGTEIASKGLLKVGGREMIEYVIDALKDVGCIHRTIVVAPESASHESWSTQVDAVIPTIGSAVDNGVAAIKHLKDNPPGLSKHMLFITCDIPLITGEAINDFIDRCLATDDDVYYPVIRREVIEAKYPETKRTYVKLKGITITGGNFALMDPEVILANLSLLQNAYTARKSPARIFNLLGIKTVLKFATHTLTLADIEKRVTKIVNARVRAIVTPYPEVGIDVDKSEDLELISSLLATADT